MLARHDWVTPTLGGGAWLEKPPLYYWQAMVAYRLFGVSDWAARLPSVFDAFALVFAVYCFLRCFRPGFELDGALMVAPAAGVVGYARAASMDMALAAAFTIAMLAWYAWFEKGSRRHLAAFYVFMALSMLAKGPVAPFLAAVVIVIFAAAQRSMQIAWKTFWPPGIALFCAMGFPWYVLAQLRNPQFFRVFILEHNLARFGTNLYHHPEPFWYHIPVTLLGWVPWSVFVTAALAVAIWRFRNRDVDTLSTFLVIWLAVIVVFFSISRSKLPGYILPVMAPGILLVAEYVRGRFAQKPMLAIAGLHAALSASLIFSALMVQYILLQHRVPRNSASVVPLVVAVISAVIIVLLLRSGYRALRIVTLVPAVMALALVLRFGAPILDETLSARPVANALSQFDPHHLPLAVFLVPREMEFGLEFYRNQTLSRYELGKIPDGEHLVVAAQGFQKEIAKTVPGRRVVYLGDFVAQKVEYFYVSAR